MVNLLTIGLSSYNVRAHVANDIPVHNGFIAAKDLTTQANIDDIQEWTSNRKMRLNQKKLCAIIFNFTHNFQFTLRLTMEGKPLDIVDHTKLLGLIVSSDLSWSKNTQYLIKRANSRMELLRRIAGFNAPTKDLVQIYITYIRSILEQSCVIWHSTLTKEDSDNLERVQKNALQNILKE